MCWRFKRKVVPLPSVDGVVQSSSGPVPPDGIHLSTTTHPHGKVNFDASDDSHSHGKNADTKNNNNKNGNVNKGSVIIAADASHGGVRSPNARPTLPVARGDHDVDDWPVLTLDYVRNMLHRPGIRGGGGHAALRRRLSLGQWIELPVFVSSTFLDMHSERDLLSARAFRRLERKLQDDGYKIKIREIDLRWGITQEETDQGLGVEICLELVHMCRPFFLGLIGRRYGWQPDSSSYGVSNPDSPLFSQWLSRFPAGRSVTELEMFFATTPYTDEDGRVVHPRALVYERDGAFLDTPEFASDAATKPSLRAHFEQEPALVEGLKRRLSARGVHVRRYACKWSGAQCIVDEEGLAGGEVARDGVPRDSVGLLEDMVMNDLGAAVRAAFIPAPKHVTALDQSRNDHASFAEDCGSSAFGRDVIVSRLTSFAATGVLDTGVTRTTPKVVVLVATPGIGKSAVMARVVTALSESSHSVPVVSHFVGPVVGSSGVRQLLPRLCQEIARIGIDMSTTGVGSDAGTESYVELVNKGILGKAMADACTRVGRIAIVIDALNQLDDLDGAHEMRWLPKDIPDGVTVLVSAVEGRCTDALRRRTDVEFEVLQGLDDHEQRKEIVRRLLGAYGKRLGETACVGATVDGDDTQVPGMSQMDVLVSKACANSPLYLALACEEVRLFGDYGNKGDAVTLRIASLPGDVPGLLVQVLDRLEERHGCDIICDALSLLACARHGLGAEELRHALVIAGHVSDAQGRLPSRLWFELEVSLRPFLKTSVNGDGEQLLGFFHRQLALAVRIKYMAKCPANCVAFGVGDRCVHLSSPNTSDERSRRIHTILASLFDSAANTAAIGCKDGRATLRTLSESLYHRAMNGDASHVAAFLCNFGYLDARTALGDAQGIAEDFAWTETMFESNEDPVHVKVRSMRRFFQSHIHEFVKYPVAARVLVAALNGADEKTLLPESQRSACVANVRAAGAPVVVHRNRSTEPERCVGVLEAHTAAVSACPVSADGRIIATASLDATARLWDARTGQCTAVLEGHTAQILRCAMTVDGSMLATASGDSTVCLWDTASGRLVFSLAGHVGGVFGCAFSTDGRLLVTCSADRTGRVWDVASGECSAVLVGHDDWVTGCCMVTPNASLVATCSGDKTVRIWNGIDNRLLAALGGHTASIAAITCHMESGTIATVSNDATARLWKVTWDGVTWDGSASAGCLGLLEGHSDAVLCCAFSTDGVLLVTGSNDRSARLWRVYDGACLHTVTGHTNQIPSVAFALGGTAFVTCSMDRRICLWDVTSGKAIDVLRGHAGAVLSCSVGNNGTQLVTCSGDKTVRVWDLSLSALNRDSMPESTNSVAMGYHDAMQSACVFSPSGQVVATTSRDGSAGVYDCNGRLLAYMPGHTGTLNGCAFSCDSSLLATASDDRTCRVWNIAPLLSADSVATSRSSPPPVVDFIVLSGHKMGLTACTFSHRGRMLLTASDDRTARVWTQSQPSTAESAFTCTQVLQGHTLGLRTCSFSPDDSLVATLSNDKTARLWSTDRWASVVLEGHTASVIQCDFSADSKVLITCSNDKTTRGWATDAASRGTCLFVLEGHAAAVTCCTFSADNRIIASSSDDRTVRLWSFSEKRSTGALQSLFNTVGKGFGKAIGKETASGTPVCAQILRGHTTAVTWCAFSPDGKFVASVSSNGVVIHPTGVSRASGAGEWASPSLSWAILLSGGAVRCAIRPSGGSNTPGCTAVNNSNNTDARAAHAPPQSTPQSLVSSFLSSFSASAPALTPTVPASASSWVTAVTHGASCALLDVEWTAVTGD